MDGPACSEFSEQHRRKQGASSTSLTCWEQSQRDLWGLPPFLVPSVGEASLTWQRLSTPLLEITQAGHQSGTEEKNKGFASEITPGIGSKRDLTEAFRSL